MFQYKSLNDGLGDELSNLTISQIFTGILNRKLRHGYIFDIPVAKSHHIIIRLPDSLGPRSMEFSFTFLDYYSTMIERAAKATTNVHGQLIIIFGKTRYDSDDIKDFINNNLLYKWKILESNVEKAYLLAKSSLVTKTVSIPIIQLNVPASLALICLATLSLMITGIISSNLRELCRLEEFADRGEPWILLDSALSPQQAWFDRLSAVIERISGYLFYPIIIATPLIVTGMYVSLQPLWTMLTISTAIILAIFSFLLVLSSCYNLLKVVSHYKAWIILKQLWFFLAHILL
jgi:hypothetical protein